MHVCECACRHQRTASPMTDHMSARDGAKVKGLGLDALTAEPSLWPTLANY